MYPKTRRTLFNLPQDGPNFQEICDDFTENTNMRIKDYYDYRCDAQYKLGYDEEEGFSTQSRCYGSQVALQERDARQYCKALLAEMVTSRKRRLGHADECLQIAKMLLVHKNHFDRSYFMHSVQRYFERLPQRQKHQVEEVESSEEELTDDNSDVADGNFTGPATYYWGAWLSIWKPIVSIALLALLPLLLKYNTTSASPGGRSLDNSQFSSLLASTINDTTQLSAFSLAMRSQATALTYSVWQNKELCELAWLGRSHLPCSGLKMQGEALQVPTFKTAIGLDDFIDSMNLSLTSTVQRIEEDLGTLFSPGSARWVPRLFFWREHHRSSTAVNEFGRKVQHYWEASFVNILKQSSNWTVHNAVQGLSQSKYMITYVDQLINQNVQEMSELESKYAQSIQQRWWDSWIWDLQSSHYRKKEERRHADYNHRLNILQNWIRALKYLKTVNDEVFLGYQALLPSLRDTDMQLDRIKHIVSDLKIGLGSEGKEKADLKKLKRFVAKMDSLQDNHYFLKEKYKAHWDEVSRNCHERMQVKNRGYDLIPCLMKEVQRQNRWEGS